MERRCKSFQDLNRFSNTAFIYIFFVQLTSVFSMKCGRYSVGSVRGQGRHCLLFASTSQGPVNHKSNESQMNTAAFADHRV